VSDLFAERFAAVRQRFAAKLDARIEEIEAQIETALRGPSLGGAPETLANAHRRAHDLCGVGPTMGFVATGQAARSIEQVLLAAIKAGRGLTPEEVVRTRAGIALLRSAASAESRPASQE
jgi:HPt (histidine-containing phosphotransfer) domain-containing protein